MCTFLISNKWAGWEITSKLKKGGPDHTSITNYDKYSFTHNLLWITGPKTTQPYETSKYDFYLLGEMYNWNKTLSSELENIASLYETYGDSFTNYIEGEFLIIIVNKDTLEIDFFNDPWATRQCWFYQEDDFWCFSTFKYSEKAARMPHNSHCRWDGNTLHLINGCLHLWDLTQRKDTLKDVHAAIDSAMKRRWHQDGVLLLSGGIDSSVVAASLHDQNLPIYSYSFDLAGKESKESYKSIKDYCSIHTHNWIDSFGRHSLLTGIAVKIRQEHSKKVLLTGNEADGIFENYRNKTRSLSYSMVDNQFKLFPSELSQIFPWHHFYWGTLRRICDAWETVFLTYAIENRNCFLDKQLVQEWLSLTPSLKNKRHKHFLKSYLEKRDIVLTDKKIGMTVHRKEKPLPRNLITYTH